MLLGKQLLSSSFWISRPPAENFQKMISRENQQAEGVNCNFFIKINGIVLCTFVVCDVELGIALYI